MAYRVKPQETIAAGLRRLARKELQAAREQLRTRTPPPDSAIHEARKSLKKVRAIRDVIEADEGAGARRAGRALRKVSRTLSDLRDASAMLEVFKKLKRRNPRLFDEHTYARLRRQLKSHKYSSRQHARGDAVWKKIDRDLRAVRRDAKRWQPTHRGFGALAAGVRDTFRRGRKALARAKARKGADDFHEWRKQLKALWYELRLIEASSPEIRRDVAVLHRAETALGDDHNLVVLCEQLSEDAAACDLERVRRAADRFQRSLRRQAIAETKRIYSRRPRAYVRRLKRAWKAWPARSRPLGRRRTAA